MLQKSLLACVLIAGCAPESDGYKPRDLAGQGVDDGGGGGDDAATDDMDATGSVDMDGTGVQDGAGAYDDIGQAGGDGGNGCVPPNTGATCANPMPSNAGCKFGTADDCGPTGMAKGSDDK